MKNAAFILVILTGGLISFRSFAAERAPVVVELFESEGCSSCPPAELALARLSRQFGSKVVLLNYHVDYWDYLGWKDPYSDADWTQRQQSYAARFGRNEVYTPQMVIQGDLGFVGSNYQKASTEISERSGREANPAAVNAVLLNPAQLRISAKGFKNLGPKDRLWVALVENAPSVRVLRGENAGVTMSGEHVVRKLVEMPRVRGDASTLTVDLPDKKGSGPWSAVVLVEGANGHLEAATPMTIP